jgi:regulator of sigma E protease
VVLIHELGHFLVARLCGVPVDRFSIGFGPKVVGFKRGGTEYVISAVPLGGYVKMAGEEALESDAPPPPDTFLGHPWWHRVLIALAGPGANFVFAFVVLTLLYFTGMSYPDSANIVGRVGAGSVMERVGLVSRDTIVEVAGKPTTRGGEVRLALVGGEAEPLRKHPIDLALVVDRGGTRVPLTVPAAALNALADSLLFYGPPVIGEVVNGTPAYVAGLAAGDRITAIDGEPVDEWLTVLERVSARPGKSTQFTIERGGQTRTISVTPLRQEEGGKEVGRIGVFAESRTWTARYPLPQSIQYGARQTVDLSAAQFAAIGSLIRHPAGIGQSMSGPLAIMEMTGRAAEKGASDLFRLVALISVALMAFNLLPIPVLDGGLIVMAIAEGIRRRPVPVKVQLLFQQVGLVLLGSLILFVLFNDPLKMIRRSRALRQHGAPATTEPAATPPTGTDGTGH